MTAQACLVCGQPFKRLKQHLTLGHGVQDTDAVAMVKAAPMVDMDVKFNPRPAKHIDVLDRLDQLDAPRPVLTSKADRLAFIREQVASGDRSKVAQRREYQKRYHAGQLVTRPYQKVNTLKGTD